MADTPREHRAKQRDPLRSPESVAFEDVTRAVSIVIVPISSYKRVRIGLLLDDDRSVSAVLMATDARRLAHAILAHVGNEPAEAEYAKIKLSTAGLRKRPKT